MIIAYRLGRQIYICACGIAELFKVLVKFFLAYSSIRNPGKYMDAYSRRFILRDKKIVYFSGEKKHRGKVLDVDKSTGSLIIEGKGGEQIIIKSPSSVVMPKKVKI